MLKEKYSNQDKRVTKKVTIVVTCQMHTFLSQI